MSAFLHKVAEGLRTREKFLEDHDNHPAFSEESGKTFRQEYQTLLAELQAFTKRVRSLHNAKEDFDEHFEKEIEDANDLIAVKIDTWYKRLPNKH
tara:strand:- start:342 stop:626 length:285 start_codon:yes stop_codon:yes gene_type:complete